ncbi:helix-turn-helix domain-containing protein [Tumebacillus avium]|nr:helix-turn-helix transcriptional regulator [Tumebacillus avium]
MQIIGTRLKCLREKKGVSQKTVAAHLGIDRTTYTRYELGESKPKYHNLCLLAEYFGTSPDFLLGQLVEENAILPTTEGKTIKEIRDEIAQNKILDVNGKPMSPEVRDDYIKVLDLPIKLRELKLRDAREGQ